jgi:magnesium transporter
MESGFQRQWNELARLLRAGTALEIRQLLRRVPGKVAGRLVSRLQRKDQQRVLTTLGPEDAADLIEEIPEAQAADLMEQLPPGAAAAILEEMPSNEQADLISALPHGGAEAILAEMDAAEAAFVRRLAGYAPDVAGGIMITEYLAYAESSTIGSVLADLRAHADEYVDYSVQYLYIVAAEDGRLRGVLPLRDLILAPSAGRVTEYMIPDPIAVSDQTPLSEVAATFDERGFLAVPVVDLEQRLTGVVRRHDVEEAIGDQAEGDYLKSQGIVGGEELRTMPLFNRARRRLSWLSVNIVLNLIAASVIAFYQDTISAVIALAVFLPIVSDMSGCSGNQAVAVSMREMALGLVEPSEAFRVWRQEILAGLLTGSVLGLLLGGVAWLWQRNATLGLVIGGALALNTVVAASIGGALPLLLKRFGADPALAAGPILTTITDLCGFFLVLSLASATLARIAAG